MPEGVAAGVDRPLIIFDGKCSFCRRSVQRAKSITGQFVDYEPYQQVGERFPQVEFAAFGRAVHLIEPGGRVSRGAEAVFRALSLGGRYPWLLRFYDHLPGFAGITEFLYARIAANREVADWLDMRLIGPVEYVSSYRFTRQIFLRFLGLVYLIAFLSLWSQIDGLVGSHGILPVQSFLNEVRSFLGTERYFQLPTLCWLNPSDGFLHFLCAGGVAAAVLLIAGFAQLPALIVLFAFYLSLSVAGQDFFWFQWDSLLLETGFLAIFFSCVRRATEPSRTVLWLLRWLLFRLIFMSGVVKLSSGDPNWHNWTALQYHYMTQPLPTWIGWYFAHFPLWFQKLSCGVVFLSELGIPFLIFGPRRVRLIAFWGIVTFQLLIMATGNYGFFNLLTIALCCLLPDDVFWRRVFRRPTVSQSLPPPPGWRAWITLPLAAILLSVTIPICVDAFRVPISWPKPIVFLGDQLEPFRIVSGYGLFQVMTTERPEIIIEGSDDGENWKAYEFKWKPGDLRRAPAFTFFHMPRLDWQMWFAALGDASNNRWLVLLLNRLQEGSEPVIGLLQTNPSPGHGPRYIRAVLYDYQSTDLATRRATGKWWGRQRLGMYYEQ